MDDFVRAVPVHLRRSSIDSVDEFASAEHVSRSAVLRAAIELGLRQLRAAPELIKEVLPATTYGRGVPRPRLVTKPSKQEEP